MELNEETSHRIGRSAAEIFKTENTVVGYYAWATSIELASSVEDCVRGTCGQGEDIGLAVTAQITYADNFLLQRLTGYELNTSFDGRMQKFVV